MKRAGEQHPLKVNSINLPHPREGARFTPSDGGRTQGHMGNPCYLTPKSALQGLSDFFSVVEPRDEAKSYVHTC